MLYKEVNQGLNDLLSHLLCSIKQIENHNEGVETTHSGVYNKADACHRLLLSGSRNFIFEFYDSSDNLKEKMKSPEKTLFLQQLKNAQFEHLTSVSKKSHFTCFQFLDNLAIKPLFDFGDKSYLYIPINRFCDHLVHYQSSLGLCHFELMQYFNFLDLYYQSNQIENCYIVNLYKNKRISVFTFAEVENAFNGFLSNQDQPMDLSITARLQ